MKKIMNFSKLAISTLIVSSAFVACSEEITENTVDTHYTANASNIKTAGTAVDLGLPSGTKWANMNVGATSEKDNGVLFLWGDITGTQITPNSLTTYTDIVGDTVGLDSATRAAIDCQKVAAIYSYVEAKLNDVIGKGTTGFLEASLTNMDFEMLYNWDGSDFSVRLPDLNEALKLGKDEKGNKIAPTAQDTLNYFQRYKYDKSTSLSIDLLGSRDVQYNKSDKANNYAEIKDQFGVTKRKDYSGGDIAGAPIYKIIGNAKLDPATANWGANWVMPTSEQLKELVEKCTWEFTGSGYTVTESKAIATASSCPLQASVTKTNGMETEMPAIMLQVKSGVLTTSHQWLIRITAQRVLSMLMRQCPERWFSSMASIILKASTTTSTSAMDSLSDL